MIAISLTKEHKAVAKARVDIDALQVQLHLVNLENVFSGRGLRVEGLRFRV